MTVKQEIETKLARALQPSQLDVIDESHLHKGHIGARPEGETHFRLVIVSAAFEGLTRIERHRKVQTLLKDELAGPVHALAMKTIAPSERADQ